MAKTKKIAVPMTQKQQTWGFVYLVISIFLLPLLLNSMNGLLLHPLSSVWVNFLYFCLNFTFLWVIFQDFLRKSMVYAGKHLGAFLGFSILGFAMYFAANMLLSALIRLLLPGFSNVNDVNILQQLSDNYWIMVIGTIFLVPTAEELLHRGLVFGTLYRVNPIMGYAVSMVAFAAIHVMGYIGKADILTLLVCFVQYLPAGWVLAWCYRRSGCIFVPILIHTVINAMSLVAVR